MTDRPGDTSVGVLLMAYGTPRHPDEIEATLGGWGLDVARLARGEDPVRALSGARRERAGETAHPAHWALFDVLLLPDSPS